MTKVLKFGGTSVGSSQNIRQVASIIKNENAKLTVLSAMSETTNYLVKICSEALNGKTDKESIDYLVAKYQKCAGELISENIENAKKKIESTFSMIEEETKKYCSLTSEKLILAQGELLTTAMFTMFLNEIGQKAVLINITDHMYCNSDGKVDTVRLKKGLNDIISQYEEGTFFITQGFICRNSEGNLDNLGRGGSDYSAALMGAAINAKEVQIWTDIDGMHNNDPRYVENTYPIRKLTFTEAAELAYFGAKILHPATIQPCKELGITVRLKNTMDPSAEGTSITDEGDESTKFHAIAAKDDITVIRICSARMLMAYGFLRKIFEVFEKYRTPIDMITTSEVAVSLTIDNDTHLKDIIAELEPFGNVYKEKNCSIVSVVGKIGHEESGLAAHVLDGIKNIPIKMISYGASPQSISLLINSSDKIQTLRQLNKHIFENKILN